jgi:hypothetical protein
VFCAISAHTVASLRRDALARSPERLESAKSERRIGLDGKRRPLDHAELRERIASEIRREPNRSLREIAAAISSSPETVRLVKRLIAGDDLAAGERAENTVEALPCWARDTALRTMTDGTTFLEWFERTAIDPSWSGYVDRVPLGRVYEIADEARRRAADWRTFAEALEKRVQGGRW